MYSFRGQTPGVNFHLDDGPGKEQPECADLLRDPAR